MNVVEVAVPRPLRRTFDYAVPHDVAVPQVGARVRVPFGATSVVGVVVGLRPTDTAESDVELKSLAEVLDDDALLPPDLTDLARWLARYYHHPIGEAFATVLPALARRGGPAKVGGPVCWRCTDVEPGDALLRAPRQRHAYERLLALGSIAASELAEFGIERRHLAALIDKGLAERYVDKPAYRAPTTWARQLSHEQRAAVQAVVGTLGTQATHLLEGVTGSGKTEVYLRAIAEVLARGGQALVLVPEIALTPQTTARFRDCFGSAATLHSGHTDGQRFEVWQRCRLGVDKVLIGTRSAALTPFRNLQLIVVDEEHDGSFKQADGMRYSARDVAVKRGQTLSIPVLLGSATPSLESLENVRKGRYRHYRLAQRAGGARLPAMRLLDVRGLRLDRGFSEPLHGVIDRHLAAGNQVLVFVNRRGFAPVLLCTFCGWQARCSHCDARLTLHRRPDRLRCHHCGHHRPLPNACPECAATAFTQLGTGTQRAEEALAERYPNTPCFRVDRDTTRSMRRLEADLAAVRTGKPAILVGTQMLAKGHHLPGVTLVAVLDADAGFLSSDFRAPERTAALIVQVAGRAGRAAKPGEVVVQTFDPDNGNLRALQQSGYAGFATSERLVRQAAKVPPFSAMALIRAESGSESRCAAMLDAAVEVLGNEAVDLLGPAPAPIARRADRYRWQVLVLANRRGQLHRALQRLEAAPPKASGVRWSIDVDPLDTS